MSNNLDFIWWTDAPKGVDGFTSKNFGGVSIGKYQGLNLGVNTGDSSVNILKNYKILAWESRVENIIILNQVHGVQVLNVTHENQMGCYLGKADGLFTVETDIGLGIQTADCFPVLLAGKIGVSALHCGWRSLNGQIIENAIELFKLYNDFPEKAFIGPGICKDCYEIREDTVKLLNKKYNPEKALTMVGTGVYKFDLKHEVTEALQINGIENIEISPFSSCHSEGFYSYRRDKGDTGRMLTVIRRNADVGY